jgi:GNAT superfamily N-acetyltransferase
VTALGPTEPLDRKRHSVERFDCGRSTLDRWLRHFAGQGQRRDTSRTFVAADRDGAVLGYYTLVAGQIERDGVTSEVRAGTSAHFPIPVCLIARLAVDRQAQGKGLGAGLLLDALQRAVGAADLVGIRAVVVHALDDQAASFYEHFGFAATSSEPRTLMVPLAAVRRTVRPDATR